MRVFVAGATGAIGRQLVPRLVAAGHEVHGMTRSESKQAMLRELGAVPVVADALDPDQVAEAVGRARPDVIVHQLTAIGGGGHAPLRSRFRADQPPADRGHGPPALGRAGGGGAAVRGAGGSGLSARTRAPAGRSRARRTRSTLRPRGRCARPWPRSVISRRRSSVREWTEGIVLRYGAFYGPGTSMAPGEEQFELVRKRKFPLVGDGGGVWSFIHIADAAEATVAAVEHGSRGVYNVVDDDPAPVAEWLPALAQTLGAKKPMRVPRFVGRLFAGEAGVVMMTELRGASNAKAKRELAWRPAHPSWRQGFAAA